MPRSKRQNVILRHEQALQAIEKALDYVAELHDMFAVHHPDHARGYENILYVLAQGYEFLDKMKSFV